MEEYKYTGVELTPTIFCELMILLFDGKQFQRQTVIDTIVDYHKEHGGELQKNEYISVFKKACQILKQNGLYNVGYGNWRLNYKVKEVEIITQSNDKTVHYTSDKVIGCGENAVYVYYYDVYKKMADLEKADFWECKIGRTDKDPLQRVLGQAGTCYPELPHIALIIRCEDSSLLESTIHNILKMRKRWISTAPGVEWFLTSPTEIEEIYNSVIGK